MANYPNFYETLKEARMRLVNTVVLYDGDPYYIIAISNHKDDGIFRVYMDAVKPDGQLSFLKIGDCPYHWHDEPSVTVGDKMDEWLETTPGKTSNVVRKMINSPKFKKFRPFPLGMVNTEGTVVYTERSPARHTQQGLTSEMISPHMLCQSPTKKYKTKFSSVCDLSLSGGDMYYTYKGMYPTLDETLTALKDPSITNLGVGFDRHYAITRGPANMFFLAYKTDIVGLLPNRNAEVVLLTPEYFYLKEVIQESAFFNSVEVL